MKKLFFFGLSLFALAILNGQSLIGAWEAQITEGTQNLRSVVIFSDGYQTNTYYDAKTGAFVNTNGGTWRLNGNTLSETVEFDTKTPQRVGTTITAEIELSDTELTIKGVNWVWKRIDNGTPGDLGGAWLISERKVAGQMQRMDTTRPRKTMKILSGTRFQWIAYNTDTKQFMGTGGGSYTTVDGKYTENIEFFSRDDSRVGSALQFEYELKNGAWHHAGLSSKGQPIYEVWTLRK